MMTTVQADFRGKDAIRLAEQPDFVVGWLKVQPSLREVHWANNQEIVEPRVMQVLVALVRAGGGVVSRDDLIRQCWEGRIVGEAAINRCIWKLRELAKAEEPPAFSIETIPRVGYRLIAPETEFSSVVDQPAALPAVTAIAPATLARMPGGHRSWASAGLAGFACIMIAATALMLYNKARSSLPFAKPTAAQSTQKPSIAVLPFKNLSAGSDTAYFAEGIQDEILTRLAKIGSLKVISRTSTDQYAVKPHNLRQIGKELSVANILEGSVQREGSKVRVNVQLIRASNDDHLWAEDYDRDLTDVFPVESEVARKIALALAARITGSEAKALDLKLTTNAEAYDFYLRALAFMQSPISPLKQNETAEFYLNSAVRADPNFAAAWALLARLEAGLAFNDAPGHYILAQRALERAQSIAPQLAETKEAEGFFKYYGKRDYRGALADFAALQKIWPNNADILRALGFVSRRLSRWDNARKYFSESLTLDPHSIENYNDLIFVLDCIHRTDEALRLIDKGLQIWPRNNTLLLWKVGMLQETGRLKEADTILKQKKPSMEDDPNLYGAQYLLTRKYAQGARFLEKLLARAESEKIPEQAIAQWLTTTAELEMRAGNTVSAHEHFLEAREKWLKALSQQPRDMSILGPLADSYAELSNQEAATRIADRAMQEYPLSKDSLDGPGAAMLRATIAIRFDDHITAIRLLKEIINVPGGPTASTLRLDPDFDRMRGDPEFKKLVHSDGR